MRRLFACLILFAAAVPADAEQTVQRAPQCSAPTEALRLTQPLVRMANRLARRQPVTIVAIGSSSTAGVGASAVETTYPSRLEAELKARIPGATIRVINHGVSGDQARDMLARFDTDVRDEHPDLVLWQLGTNTIVSETGIVPTSPIIHEGLKSHPIYRGRCGPDRPAIRAEGAALRDRRHHDRADRRCCQNRAGFRIPALRADAPLEDERGNPVR